MIDIALALGAVYLAGFLIKGYCFLLVRGPVTAAILRAHWRSTGTASQGYVAWVIFGVPAVMLLCSLVWPLLLFTEGMSVVHPYNTFGMMRNSMRTIYAVNR